MHDIHRRRPVWEALSTLFLDTELDAADYEHIAAILVASGYSLAELNRILWRELCPVLGCNCVCVAGEWDGFNMEHVEQQILSHPAGWLRRWWSYINGGNIARHGWHEVRKRLAASKP